MDNLLELERAGVGWHHHFVGAVCYANDIALLAPSLSALWIMLGTFYILRIHIHLSSMLTRHNLSNFQAPVLAVMIAPLASPFLGQELCLSKSVIHLGHILNHDLSDRDDNVATIKKDMCRKANCMLHIFLSCDARRKTKLF